jgi:membrane-bound lytic murein transglycosylase D
VDAPVDELMALNPSLLRMITPPDTSFDLHLPAGAATLFTQRIAGIPESKRNSWRYHRVVAGDTLASVARTYRVQVAELAAANQLDEKDSVDGIEALVVPVPPEAAPLAHMLLYTVRKGDTLVTIADRFGVSLNQLWRWNKISGVKVAPGRRLHVAEPATIQRTSRGHRRKGSSTGVKGHGTAPAAGSGAKSTHSPAGSGGASANRKHVRTSHAAGARKRAARKPAAHKHSSQQKQN